MTYPGEPKIYVKDGYIPVNDLHWLVQVSSLTKSPQTKTRLTDWTWDKFSLIRDIMQL